MTSPPPPPPPPPPPQVRRIYALASETVVGKEDGVEVAVDENGRTEGGGRDTWLWPYGAEAMERERASHRAMEEDMLRPFLE